MDADVIVVGAGLAGLVATAELADAGRSVILLDQEPETNLGGQAFWSFGGLFLVDSPEQRRMGIKDSHDLAWQDWLGTAGFDRDGGPLAARAGPRPTSTSRPARSAPGCTSRACAGSRSSAGPSAAATWPTGHGNSVPRFHVTWGTGPGVRRAVRAPGARGGRAAALVDVALPAPGRRR